MKKLITLSALSVAALSASAQITINQASFASWQPVTDTLQPITQVTVTPSANGSWDLTTGTYGTAYFTDRAPVSTPDYPQATYGVEAFYTFSSLQYWTQMYEGITAAGRQTFGEKMVRQAISISAMTGGANDSVVFPQQTVPYSSTRNLMMFPATVNSKWSSDYKYKTNFNLTVAAFGLNSVPGERRSHTMMNDTVKGWGKMRVKDLNGNASAYIDVLVVKRILSVSDSFYLAGNVAPAPLMAAFGLNQGQIDQRFHIFYYRAGEVEPLYVERYTDASFTTKMAAATHASRIPLPTTGVDDLSNKNSIIMYPNPVVKGTIQIILGEQAQQHKWAYELINTSGQKVAASAMYPDSGKATISLDAKTNGVYFLTIYKNGVKEATKQFLLQ